MTPANDLLGLDDTGVMQAQRAADWIHAQRRLALADAFVSSPMRRAQETADIIRPHADWITDPRFEERDKGLAENLSTRELMERFPENAAVKQRNAVTWVPVSGMSLETKGLQTLEGTSFAARASRNGIVIVCCHAEVMLAMAYNAGWKTAEQITARHEDEWVRNVIRNGTVHWYSNRDPLTKRPSRDLCWLRVVCPPELSHQLDTGWMRIENPLLKVSDDGGLHLIGHETKTTTRTYVPYGTTLPGGYGKTRYDGIDVVGLDDELPQEFSSLLYLSGPATTLWRQEAIAYLKKIGFPGTVAHPVIEGLLWDDITPEQFERQRRLDAMSDLKIVNLAAEAAGRLSVGTRMDILRDPDKCVIAIRDDQQNDPVVVEAKARGAVIEVGLEAALDRAAKILQSGVVRSGGHRQIPQDVFSLPECQRWLEAQRERDIRIVNAEVRVIRRKPTSGHEDPRGYPLIVNMDVELETSDGTKKHELLVVRPDIVMTVLVVPNWDDVRESKLVLIRELRAPALTAVIEPPAGSAEPYSNESDRTTGTREVLEEAGILLSDETQFYPLGRAQAAATLSIHRVKASVVFLNEDQARAMERSAQEGEVHGLASEGESTTAVITTFNEALTGRVRTGGEIDELDWVTKGVLYDALGKVESLRRHFTRTTLTVPESSIGRQLGPLAASESAAPPPCSRI